MSIKEKKKVNENYHSYHIRGMPHHNTVKRNCIFLSKANSVKHEIAKAVGGIMLNKWGDIIFDHPLIKHIEELSLDIESVMKDFPSKKSEFITEACANEEDRIIDLVRLSDNQRFEFETDHNIKKKNSYTIYI